MSEQFNKLNKGNQLNMVGQSDAYYQLLESIEQVGPTQISVLITGESGTGKEVIAHAIHEASQRRENPMFTVNCGAIPEGILESELFGHEKGSFTGAVDSRKGYFELAHTGTIFLDEIGEMPLATQVKLLRVLEEKAILRVGGSKKISVDVRVIAATNRNLKTAIERGEFRKDLYYRLNSVNIWIPPLRQRKEDIHPLIDHFTKIICESNQIKFAGFTPDAIHLLEDQPWPGNIRELRNLVERVVVLEKGRKIDTTTLKNHLETQESTSTSNLPVLVQKTPEQVERELIYRTLIDLRMAVDDIRTLLMSQKTQSLPTPMSEPFNYMDHTESKAISEEETPPLTMQELERQHIIDVLSRTRNNKRAAAKLLNIGERTLYRKLKEYNINA